MTPIGLWLARLVPTVGTTAHIAGAVLTGIGHTEPGLSVIALVWIVTILQSIALYVRGDFIARTLGLPTVRYGDELQVAYRRQANALAYCVLIIGFSSLIGYNVAEIVNQDKPSADVMLLQFATVLYIGAATPTAHLGWTLQPVARDTGHS